MHRSEITIDLGAVRRNARRLLEVLEGAALWAVVKADGYGHGAVDVAGVVLAEGATALCVATVTEGLELRAEFSGVRILVMGPSVGREISLAREADLELAVWELPVPEGVRAHLKLDTGMGRWGLSELPDPTTEVVGYADGFRRDMTGTEVVVEGARCSVVGTVSMDAIAVRLDQRFPADTPVTLIGNGVLAEDHARVAETINYEIVSRIESGPSRARRTVLDA